MCKEITILVLGLISSREALQEIVDSLESVQSYKPWPVYVVGEEFLTEWAKNLQDFDALILVGLDGSEEILQRLESYKSPAVVATPAQIPSFYKVLREAGGWSEGQKEPTRVVIEMGIEGFVDEIKNELEDYFRAYS